jgi:hypothetical protein
MMTSGTTAQNTEIKFFILPSIKRAMLLGACGTGLHAAAARLAVRLRDDRRRGRDALRVGRQGNEQDARGDKAGQCGRDVVKLFHHVELLMVIEKATRSFVGRSY